MREAPEMRPDLTSRSQLKSNTREFVICERMKYQAELDFRPEVDRMFERYKYHLHGRIIEIVLFPR